MTYTLELGPEGSPNVTYDADSITNVDIAKPHTALADFDLEVPWSRDLRDHALDRARVFGPSGDVLFRGYLRELDWDEQRGLTRLNGPGIGDDLRDEAIERSWQGVATVQAIREVWDNDTGFDATVIDPQTSIIVNGDTVISLDTTSEWSGELLAGSGLPVYVDSGKLKLARSVFFGTYETDTSRGGTDIDLGFGTGQRADTGAIGGLDFSSGTAAETTYLGGQFASNGDTVDMSFTTRYDIENPGFAWRYLPHDQNGDGDVGFGSMPELSISIDGTEIQGFVDGWGTFDEGVWRWDQITANEVAPLEAGNHTASVTQTVNGSSDDDEIWIDAMVVYDRDRWNNDLASSVTQDSGGDYNYIAGPTLYSDDFNWVPFAQQETDFTVVGIDLTSSGWNDTTGNQGVRVSADGGASWTTATNSTSVSADLSGNTTATVDYQVSLTGYGASREQTPATLYQGQEVDALTVTYDGSDLSIIQDDTFRGSPLTILQDLHERAGMRFVIDHAATDGGGNLVKEVESFATGEVTRTPSWSVINRNPRLSFARYRNQVTVYGALDSDGTRPKVTVQDDDEVATYGVEPHAEVRPDVETVDQARSVALSILKDRVRERDQRGTISVLPTDILPGYSYPVDWFQENDPTDTPLERVQFSEGFDQLRGSLKFQFDDDVTGTVIAQGREIDTTRKGI